MRRSIAHLGRTTALATLACALAGTLAGCSRGESAATLIAQAKDLQQKGQKKAALIQFKNALEKTPDDADARFLLAKLELDSNDPASAEKEVRRAIALHYDAGASVPLLLRALLQQGKYQQVLDETAKSAPSAPLLTLRAEAYTGLNQLPAAGQALDQALALDPASVEALTGEARLAVLRNDNHAAEGYVQQALDKEQTNVMALAFKGDLMQAEKKPEAALAAYQEVLKLQPDNRGARLAQALLHITARQYDLAQADIDAARKVSPNNYTITYAQALLEFTRGNLTAANDDVLQVLKVAPEHAPTVVLAGAIELRQEQLEQAEQHLRKAVEWQPEAGYPRRLLALTQLKRGNGADARATLAPMVSGAKGDSADAGTLALAGQIELHEQQPAQASRYFARALKAEPQQPDLHTALGMSKLAEGDQAAGVAELQRGDELSGHGLDSGTTLVRVQLRLGHLAQALAALAPLEQKYPKEAQLPFLRGSVYQQQHDGPRARASFEQALARQATYFPAVAQLAQLDAAAGQPDAASQRLSAYVAQVPNSLPAMNMLAALADARGQTAQATDWLKKAMAANPDQSAPVVQLCSQYLHTGQQQQALLLARQALTVHPADGQVLDVLGQAQVATGDVEGAVATYSTLVSIAPDRAVVHTRLAAVYMMRKSEAEAEEHLKKAIELQPSYAQAYVALATVYVRQGKNQQALDLAAQLEKQTPVAAAGYSMAGDILAPGKPQLALRAYQQAFALQPTAQLMLQQRGLLLAAGKQAEADKLLKQWQAGHPNDPVVQLALAGAALQKKQYPAAIVQLQALLAQQPHDVAVLNNLALAYQATGDARAQASAEQALALAGNNPAVLDTLGWILVGKGDTARGVDLLKKAVKLEPDEPGIGYHLAYGLNQAGDKEQARKQLQGLLAKGRQFSQMDDARALYGKL